MNSFVSPNVTQLDSPVSDHWGDNFDAKLQYLVDSAEKSFQYENSEHLKSDFEGEISSSLHSHEDDNAWNAQSFSIENGLPSPNIVGEKEVNTNESKITESATSFYNPVLTPIEPLSYDWEKISYSGDDLSTFSRVLKRTEDFQLVSFTDNLAAQNLLTSQDIYSQIITSNTPSTPMSNLSTSTLPTATASPLTPGSGVIEKKKTVRKKRVRSSKYSYDENAKPIADQLRENREIWNKICQKRKKGIYKCTHCSEMFKELIDLARHFDEHKIGRHHKCPFEDCPWSILGLPRRAELRRHCAAQHAYVIKYPDDKSESHEGYISAEKICCQYDFCDRLFKRKDSQQRHEKLVHLNPSSRFNKRIEKLKAHYKTDNVAFLIGVLEKTKKMKKENDLED